MRFRLPALLLAFLAVLLTGCGAEGAGGPSATDSGDPAAIAPAASSFYVEGVARPGGELRDGLLAAGGKLGRTTDPATLMAGLFSSATQAAETKIDFLREVDPWLGERIAVFGQSTDRDGFKSGVAIATRDEAGARKAVAAIVARKAPKAKARAYRGVAYTQVGDDVAVGFVARSLVIGDELAFRRVVNTSKGGKSVGASGKLVIAARDLRQPRIVTGYVDTRALVGDSFLLSSFASSKRAARQLKSLIDVDALQPTGFGVLADGNRVTVDSTSSTRGLKGLLRTASELTNGRPTPLLGELPGDAVGVYGAAKVGELSRTLYRQATGIFGGAAVSRQVKREYGIDLEDDVFAWIGDVAGFARGTDPKRLSGGVVITTPDPAKARTGVARLLRAAEKELDVTSKRATVPGADVAYRIRGEDGGAGWVALGGDRVVVGSSRSTTAQALKPTSRLADAPAFQRSQGALDRTGPVAFLDVGRVLGLLDRVPGVRSDKSYAGVKAYVQTIESLIAGAAAEGELQRSQFALRLK